MEHKFTNKLIEESSPYLKQHSHNPVNWYPWGDEAFKKAKEENKPIFLSIGYSTCHWCHVMEKESFESEEVAALLNESFISIKVDREERPDIDNLYMTFAHSMNGQGGWPLNAITDSDGTPFYIATYIPPKPAYGRPGIKELLNGLSDLWKSSKDEVKEYSSNIMNHIKRLNKTDGDGEISENVVSDLRGFLSGSFDKEYGGFGGEPKFPTPQNLIFLLNDYKINGNSESLKIATASLRGMYRGGIYDHACGGFSRYSVDNMWLVPHFEKMLYDNALILQCYVLAYEYTEDELFKVIAKDIISYLVREMMDEFGTFYSATDADSEGVEGKFFLWTLDEILKVTDSKEFAEIYGVTTGGNFEGENILNLIGLNGNRIEDSKLLETKIKYENELKKLCNKRQSRIKPHLDDKIITSWNAMVIKGISNAGRVFKDESLKVRSIESMDELLNKHFNNGVLLGSSLGGKPGPKGIIDDYAYLCDALIYMYSNTFQEKWLFKADEVMKLILEKFLGEDGNMVMAEMDDHDLLLNLPSVYDSAMPSGASITLKSLIALSSLTHNPGYYDIAQKFLSVNSRVISNSPQAVPTIVDAINAISEGVNEVVIYGEDKETMINDYEEFLVKRTYGQYVILLDKESKMEVFDSFFTELEKNHDTLYVCWDFNCRIPVKGKENIIESLKKM